MWNCGGDDDLIIDNDKTHLEYVRRKECVNGGLCVDIKPSYFTNKMFDKVFDDVSGTNYHRVDGFNLRKYWIWRWLGLEYFTFNSNIVGVWKSWLLKLWDNPLFYPFVSVDESHRMIMDNIYEKKETNNLHDDYVIFPIILRLSSTKPGTITLSYTIYSETTKVPILRHIRLSIDHEGVIHINNYECTINNFERILNNYLEERFERHIPSTNNSMLEECCICYKMSE